MTMSLYERLGALAGDWEAQRAVILAHKFVPQVPMEDLYLSEWVQTPDSWDDFYLATYRGYITYDQADSVEDEWTALHEPSDSE